MRLQTARMVCSFQTFSCVFIVGKDRKLTGCKKARFGAKQETQPEGEGMTNTNSSRVQLRKKFERSIRTLGTPRPVELNKETRRN